MGESAKRSAPRIAVVGTGMAGAACALKLRDGGIGVEMFDKSRGTGGRMSTRRGDGVGFDHGAPCFTADDPTFRTAVASWQSRGLVARWDARVVSLCEGAIGPRESEVRYVGLPGMSGVVRELLTEFPRRASFHVGSIEVAPESIELKAREGERSGAFDAVVLALPAPQVVPLVASIAPGLAERAGAAEFARGFAVMVQFAERLPLRFDAASVQASALSWIARDSSKPGRADAECWVLQAAPEWSRDSFEQELGKVQVALLDAFERAVGTRLPSPVLASTHRWGFARPTVPIAEDCLFESDVGVGVCGDWCGGASVESAFVSGRALADRLIAHFR